MAMKYSDFITIRESKPAYNISNEEKGEWETFIPMHSSMKYYVEL